MAGQLPNFFKLEVTLHTPPHPKWRPGSEGVLASNHNLLIILLLLTSLSSHWKFLGITYFVSTLCNKFYLYTYITYWVSTLS
jgi:hypothetical protein